MDEDEAIETLVGRLMDEAVGRVVERVISRGGDPDEIDDATWAAMVAAEYEGY